MKYYIYISDAKVDMLFPQVPHAIKKKVATEFGIDLKVLVAKRTVESESEDNRISRLEAVVSFIREYGNLGSVDKPGEYFEDTLPMRFLSITSGQPFVYLSGHTEETIVGLGGSVQHMIGGVPNANSPISSSYAFMILDLLAKAGSNINLAERVDERNLRPMVGMESNPQGGGFSVYENIEFFAKRLAHDTLNPDDYRGEEHEFGWRHVLLGTPLYLAKAD